MYIQLNFDGIKERYDFGCSLFDNPNSVVSWYNDLRLSVSQDGLYYCFARNKISGKTHRSTVFVSCNSNTTCFLSIRRMKLQSENTCKIKKVQFKIGETLTVSKKLIGVTGIIENSNARSFATANEICASFNGNNQIKDDFFIIGNDIVRNGVFVYLDELRSLKLEPNSWFGLIHEGKNYTFKTSDLSTITQLSECVPATSNKLYLMGGLTYANWNATDKNYVVNGRNSLIDYKNNKIDSVQLQVVLTDIYKGSIDSEPIWGDFETKLNLIKASGLSVFLRIWLTYPRLDNGRVSDTLYWGTGIAELNEWGVTPESGQANVAFTLADDGFRAKIVERYKSILQKAFSILGSQLLWSAPVRSSTAEFADDIEARYWYQDGSGNWIANEYTAIFSHNPKNLPKWREYLLATHGTLSAINTRWGTSYSLITDIQLPTVGTAFNNGIGHGTADCLAIHSGNRGLDFYNFRQNKAIVFANELKIATKSVWTNILFCLEVGGFTNSNAIRAATLNINAFATVFDLVKGSTGVVDSEGNANEGWDFVNINNSVQVANEMSWFDVNSAGFVANNTPLYKARIKEIAKTSINLGQQFFLVLDNPHMKSQAGVSDFDTWVATLEAMNELRDEVGEFIKPRPAINGQFTQTLRNALDSEGVIRTNWLANGGSKTNRVKINLSV